MGTTLDDAKIQLKIDTGQAERSLKELEEETKKADDARKKEKDESKKVDGVRKVREGKRKQEGRKAQAESKGVGGTLLKGAGIALAGIALADLVAEITKDIAKRRDPTGVSSAIIETVDSTVIDPLRKEIEKLKQFLPSVSEAANVIRGAETVEFGEVPATTMKELFLQFHEWKTKQAVLDIAVQNRERRNTARVIEALGEGLGKDAMRLTVGR